MSELCDHRDPSNNLSVRSGRKSGTNDYVLAVKVEHTRNQAMLVFTGRFEALSIDNFVFELRHDTLNTAPLNCLFANFSSTKPPTEVLVILHDAHPGSPHTIANQQDPDFTSFCP